MDDIGGTCDTYNSDVSLSRTNPECTNHALDIQGNDAPVDEYPVGEPLAGEPVASQIVLSEQDKLAIFAAAEEEGLELIERDEMDSSWDGEDPDLATLIAEIQEQMIGLKYESMASLPLCQNALAANKILLGNLQQRDYDNRAYAANKKAVSLGKFAARDHSDQTSDNTSLSKGSLSLVTSTKRGGVCDESRPAKRSKPAASSVSHQETTSEDSVSAQQATDPIRQTSSPPSDHELQNHDSDQSTSPSGSISDPAADLSTCDHPTNHDRQSKNQTARSMLSDVLCQLDRDRCDIKRRWDDNITSPRKADLELCASPVKENFQRMYTRVNEAHHLVEVVIHLLGSSDDDL